jgi:sporulation protein YpjB
MSVKLRSSARLIIFAMATAVVILLVLPVTANASGFVAVAAVDHATGQRSADGFSSSQETEYDRFLRSVIALYKAVNNGDAQLMFQSLSVIEYRFNLLPMSDDASPAGMQALAGQLRQMKRLLAFLNSDEQLVKSEAAALLLAADAMAKPDQPLWYNYRTVIAADLTSLQRVLAGSESAENIADTASEVLSGLNAHYEIIRTAILMGGSSKAIERSDSVLRYTSTVLNAESPKSELTKGVMQPLEEALFALFPDAKDEEQSALVPTAPGASWGWSAMMGSLIVTVLTWVGWRRYRTEDYAGLNRDKSAANRKDAAETLLERWRNRK